MRFTALLLLVALAGALVCAQNTTAGTTQAAEDPVNMQSDAPQRTTIAAQEPTEEPTEEQKENPLESAIEKGILDIKQVIKTGIDRLNKRIRDEKEQLKDNFDLLKRRFESGRFLF